MDYSAGELLLDLRYFRNIRYINPMHSKVNYYLIYGTSETQKGPKPPS